MPRKTRKTINRAKNVLYKLIKRNQRMKIREDLTSNYWEEESPFSSNIITAENDDDFLILETRTKSTKSRKEINRDYYNQMKKQNKILIKREKDRLYQRKRSQNKDFAELKRKRDREYQATRRLMDKIKKSTTTTAGSSYLHEGQPYEALFEFIDVNNFSEKTDNFPLVSDTLIKQEASETDTAVSSYCGTTPILGCNIEIVKDEIDCKTEVDGTYLQIKTEFMSDDFS